jgi:hypothetical protein
MANEFYVQMLDSFKQGVCSAGETAIFRILFTPVVR